jgi:hypothetical protein
MRRLNWYTYDDGDILPAGAMWIVHNHDGMIASIPPLPDQVGQPIPLGKVAIKPIRRYRHKRRNVGRWIAAQYARVNAKWMRAKHGASN